MTSTNRSSSHRTAGILLKIAAVLWGIWGLVHLLAGAMTISKE